MGDGQAVERAERLVVRLHLVGLRGGFGGHLGDRVTMAFTLGLTRSICLRCSASASRAESFFARMSWAISTALVKQSGEAGDSAFERPSGEERCGGNTGQDLAASGLVCDHVGHFIIPWRRPSRKLHPAPH